MSHQGSTAIIVTISVFSLLGLFACGGESSPNGPSSVEVGPSLRGSFRTAGNGQAAFTAYFAASFEDIRVEVQEDSSIVVSVDADGSFVLRGLPEGQFTLLFYRGAELIGEHLFSTVLPNMEIEIRVELAPSGEVRLLDERRTGIGHAGLEIEGTITSVSGSGHDGMLEVDGFEIKAVAGTTAIREGNRSRTMEDLRVGDRVHVKGQGPVSAQRIPAERSLSVTRIKTRSPSPPLHGLRTKPMETAAEPAHLSDERRLELSSIDAFRAAMLPERKRRPWTRATA